MSVPLILQLLMKEDPSVKKSLDDIAAKVKGTLASGPITFLPPNTAEKLKLTNDLLAQMRAESTSVASALVGVRDNLNDALKMPGLSAQIAAYGQIQAELKKIGAASEDVRRINPQLEATYRSLTTSAREGLERVADASSTLGGMAQGIAVGFAGVGTVLGGIAAGSLAVASNFEQLQARLISVTGSVGAANAAFEEAKAFAANSPFDLAGVVRADATILSFKQNAQQLLPVAAALAAGMGTDLNDAALAVSKAAAGSADAFTQLRDTYGITTKQLVQYGAVQGDTVDQLSHAEKNIDANRAALIRLINIKFGDAVARQSQTLAGAMSNVGDAAETAAASFGQNLIPIATLGARSLASMLGVVSAIPGPMKALAIAGTVVVAGIAGLGAAAFGSIAALLLLQGTLAANVLQLQKLKIEAPLAGTALQFLSTSATRVAGSMTASRLSLLAFGGSMVALGSIAATVGLALIDSWEKAEIAMGDSLAKSSRDFAETNNTFRDGIENLNRAGAAVGVTVGIVGDAGEQMRQIKDAFGNISASAVVDAFGLMGKSAKDFDEDLKRIQVSSGLVNERLKLLIDARNLLNQVDNAGSPQEQGQAVLQFDAVKSQAKQQFGIDVSDRDALEQQIKSLIQMRDRQEQNVVITQEQKKAFEEVVVPLRNAVTASTNLGKFLNLARNAESAQALSVGLAAVNEQISVNAKLAKIGTDNIDALIKMLSNPKLSADERAGAEAQLALVNQRAGIVEAQAKLEQEASRKTMEANELAFRRKKAGQETSLQEEIAFLQQQLEVVVKGGADELRIIEEIAAKKKALRAKNVADAKKSAEDEAKAARESFKNVLTGAKQGVRDTKAGLDTPSTGNSASPYPLATRANAGVEPSVLDSLQAARDRVDAWADANQALLKKYPEIRAELAKFVSDNALDIQKAKAQQLKDALATVGQTIQTDLAESVNNTQRLTVINGGLLNLQRMRSAGLIAEADGQKAINQLTKQKEQLERSISAEKAQQQGAIANLAQQNLEQELQILEARKAAGEQVDNDILAKQKEILNGKLAIIEQEKAAAIEAAQGEASAIEAIERQADLKRTNVINAETLRRIGEFGKVDEAHRASLAKREADIAKSQQSKGPLQTIEQAFSGPGSFGFGDAFSLDTLTKPLQKPVRTAVNFQQERNKVLADTGSKRDPSLANAINQAERDKKLGGLDFLPGVGGGQKRGAGGGGGGDITQSIYVNGAKLEVTKPALKAAITEVLKEVAGDAKFRGA